MAIIWGTWSVARGSSSGFSAPRAFMSSWKARVVRSVMVWMLSPLSLAAALILSSTSVMLRTYVTLG